MTQGAESVNLCYTRQHLVRNNAALGVLWLITYYSLFTFLMAKKSKQSAPKIIKRPPVVVVMGHIDHGKSTLLDTIRKSNIVSDEAGGITQHLSAYVVAHKTKDGAHETITFLDTPGHAAFQKMRLRGADVADVAILVVSAEDGVKPQTLEALESINTAKIPFIVAINKIDKPDADIPRTQASLVEHGIYIEGMGGDIPWVPISAKAGTGIDELLDLVILTADVAELTADSSATATGKVIEGRMDPKRGNTATLIITNGTLRSGQFVVADNSLSPVRIMEDFQGKSIKEASVSTPVGIIGFTDIPNVGTTFIAVNSKKEAEALIGINTDTQLQTQPHKKSSLPIVPILIKADVLGTIDAIQHELSKFESDRILVKVIDTGVGDINVSDVQNVSATEDAIIVGFNVKVERAAKDLAERLNVEIDTFNIIYELSEWLETALKNRTPKKEEEVITGTVKVLKHFSVQKHIHVLGGRVEDGVMKMNQRVHILRRDIPIGKGTIKNLQQQKSDVQQVVEGEFGMQLDTRAEIAPGDYLKPFNIVVS
jgi:translation initiation factor IF-2